MDADQLRDWVLREVDEAVRAHDARPGLDPRSWDAGHYDGYLHALTRLWAALGHDRAHLTERLSNVDAPAAAWPSYEEDHI